MVLPLKFVEVRVHQELHVVGSFESLVEELDLRRLRKQARAHTLHYLVDFLKLGREFVSAEALDGLQVVEV